MPVLPHFKEYKKDKNLVDNYIGKVAGNFVMDTDSEVIQDACKAMLQKISKNRRHQIKKELFDDVPANQVSIKSPVKGLPDEECQGLVALWSTPRHMQTCESNKDNRAKVKFQQKTGSRSYVAHVFATREERKGEELSAIEKCKATQNSKKHGYSEQVKEAIVKMEQMKNAPVPEGQHPMSDVEVVAAVLTAKCPASTFLKNAGLKSTTSASKAGKSTDVVAAHVNDLEDQLQRSELQTEAMREEMAVLKKKSEEAEAAQAVRDEYELLRKRTEEQDARYAHLMALISGGQAFGK